MFLRGIVITGLLFLVSLVAVAQTDTTFWLAAPDLQQAHGDRPIFLRLSAGAIATSATVQIPSNPSFAPITVNIPSNSSVSIDLTPNIDLIENSSVNTVENKGLKVTATGLISCYYDIANNLNGDIYALKGLNALGFKFTLPFQMAFTSGGYPNYTCSFSIVATEDNTAVTITPKNNLVGHPAGIPFVIQLNKGQTYTCQAANNIANERPGGTIVASNKPISISTKDDSLNYPGYGCADTAGDQLIPDCNAGSVFVLLKGQLFLQDSYYVFAIQDNTNITVNGAIVATINAGNYYRGLLNDPSCYIETDKPVHVFQISGFGCELGGAILPAIDNVGSSAVSVTRASTDPFYLNIITKSANISGFLVNGANNVIQATDFFAIPGTSGVWMGARIPISTATASAGQIVRVENTIGKFHMGLLHGNTSGTTRFGYFSDFERPTIKLSAYDTIYCQGSDVNIGVSTSGASNIVWTGPNGFTSSNSNLVINNFQASNVGNYTVGANTSNCGYAEKTFYLGLQTIDANFSAPSAQCLGGNNFEFNSSSIITGGNIINYTWYYGDTGIGAGLQVFHSYNSSGNYNVKLVVTTDKLCKDSIENPITVFETPAGIRYPTINILKNQPLNLQARSFGNTYLWNPSNGLSANNISNPIFRFDQSIEYLISIRSLQNCLTVDTLAARVFNSPDILVPTAFTPNNDGLNDKLDFFLIGIKQFKGLRIYNRWGQQMFVSHSEKDLWDGKYNGINQPPDVYVWYAEGFGYDDSKIFRKGLVTIIRK